MRRYRSHSEQFFLVDKIIGSVSGILTYLLPTGKWDFSTAWSLFPTFVFRYQSTLIVPRSYVIWQIMLYCISLSSYNQQVVWYSNLMILHLCQVITNESCDTANDITSLSGYNQWVVWYSKMILHLCQVMTNESCDTANYITSLSGYNQWVVWYSKMILHLCQVMTNESCDTANYITSLSGYNQWVVWYSKWYYISVRL